ncbi:MAG: Qat anti-phage system TatD family nuclease QatD [Candidatus Acidiferrales bacterium]
MISALVDFHCHLDLFPDPVTAIREAEEAGIHTLTVTTTPRAWPRNVELTNKSRLIRPALGLHPQVVPERAAEISLWEEYLPQARYVGEVGLDAGPHYYSSLDAQKEVFAHILKKCDAAGGKILTVHSVRAAAAVLHLIEEHQSSRRCKLVLHWFTGSKSEATRASELGCYFSINAAMLSKERGRDLVCALPADRILTETDAPFTRVNNRPARPSDIGSTLDMLGELRRMTSNEMATIVATNLRTLLTGKNNSASTC